MPKHDFPRQIAFETLLHFEKGGAKRFKTRLKAEQLIQKQIESQTNALSDLDRSFVNALVKGTLRQWLKLDEWIKHLTGRPLKNITPSSSSAVENGLVSVAGV